MKQRMNPRWSLLSAVLVALSLALGACGSAQEEKVRIGVYDSRAVAIAWVGTESYNQSMGSLQAVYEKAKAAGDQKRLAELEAEGAAQQKRLHMQVFSTAPVEEILAIIEDGLPGIRQNAGVTMLVSKWDKETLDKYPSAVQVDVTMALVDALHPGEGQRKSAIEIQGTEPIPLEEAEKIKDW